MKKCIGLLLLSLLLSMGVSAKVIKVLVIGNSFSEDAVEQNLHELGEADGNQIIVANMYIGGCPLEKHWRNAENDLPAYRYRKIGLDGVMHQTDSMSISRALADEQWDYISVQQASGYSGLFDTFEPYLKNLMAYLRQRCPNAHYLWHQTWAYAKDSKHEHFPYYDNDQMEMYRAIVKSAQKAMLDAGITTVVPCGTAVQDARSTFIGDKMNRDGYHLNLIYGRYTAACTWYEVLSGHSVVGNTYAPKGMTQKFVNATQSAANAAVIQPWDVTDLSK